MKRNLLPYFLPLRLQRLHSLVPLSYFCAGHARPMIQWVFIELSFSVQTAQNNRENFPSLCVLTGGAVFGMAKLDVGILALLEMELKQPGTKGKGKGSLINLGKGNDVEISSKCEKKTYGFGCCSYPLWKNNHHSR